MSKSQDAGFRQWVGLCFEVIPIAPVGLGAYINVKTRPKRGHGSVAVMCTEGKLFGVLILRSLF